MMIQRKDTNVTVLSFAVRMTTILWAFIILHSSFFLSVTFSFSFITNKQVIKLRHVSNEYACSVNRKGTKYGAAGDWWMDDYITVRK